MLITKEDKLEKPSTKLLSHLIVAFFHNNRATCRTTLYY